MKNKQSNHAKGRSFAFAQTVAGDPNTQLRTETPKINEHVWGGGEERTRRSTELASIAIAPYIRAVPA